MGHSFCWDVVDGWAGGWGSRGGSQDYVGIALMLLAGCTNSIQPPKNWLLLRWWHLHVLYHHNLHSLIPSPLTVWLFLVWGSGTSLARLSWKLTIKMSVLGYRTNTNHWLTVLGEITFVDGTVLPPPCSWYVVLSMQLTITTIFLFTFFFKWLTHNLIHS